MLQLPWLCGGSTINQLREDEQRVAVVFGVVLVLVVGVSRVCCLLVVGWVVAVMLVKVVVVLVV